MTPGVRSRGKQSQERARDTQESILITAERLFAERGVWAVSNRQISDAAGQGNNAAVGYHFGTKHDLIRAILRRHAAEIETIRREMVAAVDDRTDVRQWAECLVLPQARHLAAMGGPTWFARFAAQLMTDPGLRPMIVEDSLDSPVLQEILINLGRALGPLPAAVRIERADMTRQLMVHMFAERERAVADGDPTARPDWEAAATGLVDGLVGVWTAPVTPVRRSGRRPRRLSGGDR
ncbi:TetR/AcrR family transcriptional regulator [Microlunatus soli]|uniref:TetR/AcrR family transcriptional regulator n=1 Tax=Microlunatus soli TaxID=630515 RepID=UPI0018D2788F|nr:TetR/AcrR family transcriptional regulator [Microlunatus soli]